MICPTIPKVEYCVTTSVNGYVTDGLSGKVLCTLTPHAQSRFIALSSTVQIPDEGVIITGHVRPHNNTHEEAPTEWKVGAPVFIEKGRAYRISDDTQTVTVLPHGNGTLSNFSLLYTPADARTAPLIAVPEGVTLHWAGDTEPTWEAGKDYVIQLLQTSPTHIEARLFNAPAGVNVGEGDYLIWEPHVEEQPLLLKKARLNYQKQGKYQFATYCDAANLSEKLNTAAFSEQLDGSYQFSGLRTGDTLTLESATFAKQTNGTGQFSGSSISISLPDATFGEQVDGSYQFSGDTYGKGNIYLPKATFAKETSARDQFMNRGNVYLPNATFDTLADVTRLFFSGLNEGIYAPRATFRSAKSIYIFSSGHGDSYFPSATFENVTSVTSLSWDAFAAKTVDFASATFFKAVSVSNGFNGWTPKGTRMYSLNMRSVTTCNMWTTHIKPADTTDELKESFLAMVYGPRLIDGEPAPVLKTDPETGDPASLAPPELTGARLPDDHIHPTGWGIQDFRVVDESTGEFQKDEFGNFVYRSTNHTVGVPFDATARLISEGGTESYGHDIAQALYDMKLRGWDNISFH